jgi:hypothetical protein
MKVRQCIVYFYQLSDEDIIDILFTQFYKSLPYHIEYDINEIRVDKNISEGFTYLNLYLKNMTGYFLRSCYHHERNHEFLEADLREPLESIITELGTLTQIIRKRKIATI